MPLFQSGGNIKIWNLCILSLLLINMGAMIFPAGKIMAPMLMSTIYTEVEIQPMNMTFLCLLVFVSMFVINWGGSYMASQFKLPLFYVSLMAFISSMLLLTLSESLLLVFIGWEGLGVSSFLLIMFYQNWMSAKGALLTLLTNRLGDAILMILFCYWISILAKTTSLSNTFFFFICLVLVSITKSAQWPFVNWLPAAMAAPTPVSALVHSSTLVTAGVWILIRFSSISFIFMTTCLVLGMTTLSVASTSAMSEKDGKKVVALSTLSQLGMMFIAISLGNQFICFFHVLTHALAKANLFLVVGELLHKSFSEQDSRHMLSSALMKPLMMCASISVFSLMGLLFTSGFFSKEQILSGQYFYMSSLLSWALLIMISGLTLSYCFKLLWTLSLMSSSCLASSGNLSMLSTSSLLVLSSAALLMGWVLAYNASVYGVFTLNPQGWYWILILSGILLLYFSLTKDFITMLGFFSQSKMLDLLFLETLSFFKKMTINLGSSSSETLLLTLSVHLNSLVKHSVRTMFALTSLILMIILL